jgi:ubiquinone biosynthesis protein UbiJ
MPSFILALLAQQWQLCLQRPECSSLLPLFHQHPLKLSIHPLRSAFLFTVNTPPLKAAVEKVEHHHPCSASITGSLNAFLNHLKILSSGGRSFGKGLHLQGDAALLEAYASVFATLSLDWEELFSPYLGDVGSHHLGRFLRLGHQRFKTLGHRLFEQSYAYVHQESELFVSTQDIQGFCEEVDHLLQKWERLLEKAESLTL